MSPLVLADRVPGPVVHVARHEALPGAENQVVNGALLFIVLSVGVGCGEDRSAEVGAAPPTWWTENEYRFGDSPEREIFFTAPEVRADPARGRIFAVDRPNHQVSVFTPDGTFLFRVGRKGEGPGEFTDIGSLHIEPDGGFAVQEARRGRYARFTPHGELVGTTPGPPAALSYQGLPVDIHWPADGSHLGLPLIPSELEAGWARLRRSYYDGLHQPEYVPPSEGPPVLTASEEVWIRTPEILDTLRVYYAMPRGDSTGVPRRVLVPKLSRIAGDMDAVKAHLEAD